LNVLQRESGARPCTRLRAPRSPAAPAGALLPTVSFVDQSTRLARQSLALALAGVLLIVGGLVAERLWLTAAHLGAADRLARAERLAGELLLADLRLTAAAQMAVATGARRWVDAYDQHLLELDHALAHARAMAPPAAAERFDAQTREANDELAGMRESAFEAVNVGAVDVARIIFEGQRYRAHTQLLGAATAEFTAAVVQSTEAERAGLERRALMVGTAALLAAVLMGAALWSQVGARLKHWRGFYLDAEARTQRLASSDLLTGLANRAALHDAMTAAMARAAREGRGLALLMIDLDRFKPVNDRHGHLIGDRVLKEVAQRLGQCLRAGEVRARYGGDEFVVLIDELDDPTATMVAARRIVQVLGEGMVIDALMLSVGASIGIARYPDDAYTEDELLRRADSAFYRAKASHRGGVASTMPSWTGRWPSARIWSRRSATASCVASSFRTTSRSWRSTAALCSRSKCCAAGTIPGAGCWRRHTSSRWLKTPVSSG